jgi:hypothetical protein
MRRALATTRFKDEAAELHEFYTASLPAERAGAIPVAGVSN